MIVKCQNDQCPKKNNCRRFVDIMKIGQKFYPWKPNKHGRCFGYFKIEKMIKKEE